MEAIEAKATLKFERISPYKTRLVANLIRGKNVEEAKKILAFSDKRGARVILKLLNSAVANAEVKNVEDPEILSVSEIQVEQGPAHRRQMPRARGKADIIRRPTSHITIVVKEDIAAKEEAVKKQAAIEAKKAKKREAKKKKEAAKPAEKKAEKKEEKAPAKKSKAKSPAKKKDKEDKYGMGQKTHPIGFRLGVIKDWQSSWYAGTATYADQLHADMKLRTFIKKGLGHAGLSNILIERKGKQVRITIFAARPGIIIGKRGQEVDRLKVSIQKMVPDNEVFLNIKEVRRPELDAQLVAESVALQLERRVVFRRAMKKAVSTSMRFGAKGIRINCAGRLAGAEIARTEWYREGRVPLHTIRADIDYGFAEAKTTYGIIGVKVWIFTGEVFFGREARKIEEQKKLQSQKQVEEAVEAAKADLADKVGSKGSVPDSKVVDKSASKEATE